MSGKTKFKEMSRKDSGIAQMITWFDGYASLHVVDPLRIEKLVKSQSGTDLDLIWKSAKKDVWTIADLPAGSEQVKRFSRIASLARLASIIMVTVSFALLIFLYLFHSDLKMLGNSLTVPVLIFGVLYVSLMVSLYSSRRVNSAVRSFYQEHDSELSKSKLRLRQSVQTLIDRLQRDVASHDLDPMRFRFQVFNTDYRNIDVLKGRGPRHSAIVRTTRASHKE